MTSQRIQHLLYILGMIGIIRRSNCELPVGPFEGAEHDEYLNEYVFFDEGKYLGQLQQEFDDTMLEIDLINRDRRHRVTHEEPRVLYQIGVSQIVDVTVTVTLTRALIASSVFRLAIYY